MSDDELTSQERVQADRDLDDESLWSAPVEAPEDIQSGRHRPRRAQVAIRLDEELLDTVQRIANEAGVGYTTMLRHWIAERAEAEQAHVSARQQPANGVAHVITVWFSGDDWVVARRLPDGTEQTVYKHAHYLVALRAAHDIATAEGAADLDIQWSESQAEPYWQRVARSPADDHDAADIRHASEG